MSVGGVNRQFSKFSETSAKDVFGMLAEMNKKIDMITEKADSTRGDMPALSMHSGNTAPPAAGKSPQF